MSLYLKDLVTVFFLEIRDDGLFVFFSIHSCSVWDNLLLFFVWLIFGLYSNYHNCILLTYIYIYTWLIFTRWFFSDLFVNMVRFWRAKIDPNDSHAKMSLRRFAAEVFEVIDLGWRSGALGYVVTLGVRHPRVRHPRWVKSPGLLKSLKLHVFLELNLKFLLAKEGSPLKFNEWRLLKQDGFWKLHLRLQIWRHFGYCWSLC